MISEIKNSLNSRMKMTKEKVSESEGRSIVIFQSEEERKNKFSNK